MPTLANGRFKVVVTGATGGITAAAQAALGASEAARDDAEASAITSGEARDVALAAGVPYADETAFLAGVAIGEYGAYWDNGEIVFAQNVGGVATPLSGPWLDAARIGFSQSGAGAVVRDVQQELERWVIVDHFGAAGEGGDDTAIFAEALARCTDGTVLKGTPGKTYSLSTLNVPDGVGGMDFRGSVITGQGASAVGSGLIVLGAANAGVKNARFALVMDMSDGDLTAIRGYDTQNVDFSGTRIFGFINDPTNNHYGIRLTGDNVKDIIVDRYHFTGFNNPTQRGFGFTSEGGGSTPFGGHFTGTVVRATNPAINIKITNSTFVNGSYACNWLATENSIFQGNYCINCNHRGIFTANASWNNQIIGNHFLFCKSTAVLLTYGSGRTTVKDNIITSDATSIGGEAAVNVQNSSCDNTVSGNKINMPCNFGVYVSTDSQRNTVSRNEVEGHYVAAIALENDWSPTSPVNALFDRPNYASPDGADATADRWSFHDLTGNVISKNIIKQGYNGRNTAAIALSQKSEGNGSDPGTYTGFGETTIIGNEVVSGTNIIFDLSIFAEDVSKISAKVIYRGNITRPDNGGQFITNSGPTAPNQFFKEHSDNGYVGRQSLEAQAFTFADGDTTPSVNVNNSKRVMAFANTTSTSVTDFDDAYEGQIITVNMDSNTTIVHNSALIRTKGSVNITGNSNDFVTFISRAGVWREMYRSF